MATQVSCKLGDKEIVIETGKLARQAGGSVTVRCGDSIVLVTATAAQDKKEGADFIPLTVEYLEKTFAAGKIPGGFFKREGRPSENAILTARFIDRPIRPLLPKYWHYDTQVIATVLSASQDNNPDTLAMIGASASLCLSDIPLAKPLAGCRVARINGAFQLNPGIFEMEHSDMELIVAASEDAVVMVEGGSKELSEDVLIEAIQFAHNALKPVIAIQKDLMQKLGKPKRAVPVYATEDRIVTAVNGVEGKVREALAIAVKLERYAALKVIKDEIKKSLFGDTLVTPAQKLQFNGEYEELKSRLMRNSILGERKRIDKRGYTDIRQISCEAGLLPRAHGSALFTRGETQALVAVTLGSSEDEQLIDGLLVEHSKTFMLNYNFPPFSVGETKPLRSPGRREIGHGHLAERSLARVLPSTEDFPYTIRIVSEILESNGSSSMASVCGGSLALMDAGIPIKSPVAGIAMGLVKEGDKTAILSDILGDEDHLGDMDFKVTGTRQGVTALQMDIKIEGVTAVIMRDALEQARQGRLHILSCMDQSLATPRSALAEHAPKIEAFTIPPEKIGEVIGPGGKYIKAMVEETQVKIDIEDSGLVKIFGTDPAMMARAKELVRMHAAVMEVGQMFTGTVVRIVDFGAFVELTPKTDGLVHISQICNRRINKVTDVLHEGDKVTVKVINVEPNGKVRLTMKDIQQPQQNAARG